MKLYKKEPCPVCSKHKRSFPAWQCEHCGERRYIYAEVDPAELEMAVLGAWEKVKGKVDKERMDIDAGTFRWRVLGFMADLESGLDLGEIRKIREKAAAWDYALAIHGSLLDGYLQKVRCDLAQAHADLRRERRRP